jgi:hypothetical protein
MGGLQKLFGGYKGWAGICSGDRDGKLAFHMLLEDEYHNIIIYAFEELLCYWVWLKNDFHWKKGDATDGMVFAIHNQNERVLLDSSLTTVYSCLQKH